MSYTIDKNLGKLDFEEVIQKTKDALKEEGFGVLTEIDMKATMKAKLDEDIEPYMILGACNPPFAFKALQSEPKVGAMLPCNVIVRSTENGIEVSAVDPMASMQAIENDSLGEVAQEVKQRLEKVIQSL